MKLWQKITLAVVVLVALFAVTAPASLITEALPDNSSGFSLSGFQGKAVKGSVSQVAARGIVITNVAWDINVLSSLSGTPSALISIDDPAIKLESAVTFVDERQWSVSELNGTLSLEQIASVIPQLRTIQPGGTADLTQINIALDRSAFTTANGDLQWNNAALLLNNYRFDLGTMTGNLRLDGDKLALDYESDSQLAPTGVITLSPTGDYEMLMEIQPSALPADVQWVTRLGKATATGAISYTMKGRLR